MFFSGFCLRKVLPLGFCGDGRVDPGEECDCGSVESCLAARSCCAPPGLRRGELACHWRRSLPACRETSASTGEQKTVAVGRKKNTKKDKTGNNKMAGFMADKMAEKKEESLCNVLGLKPCRCKIISVTVHLSADVTRIASGESIWGSRSKKDRLLKNQ